MSRHLPRISALSCWLSIVVCVFCMGLAVESRAEIYKCVDAQGRAQFSDKPCAVNAEKIELNVPESSGVDLGGTGDFSEISGANKKRDGQRRYQAAQRKLATLRRDYDRKMAALDKRARSLPNNPRAKRERKEISEKRSRLRERYREDRKRANAALSRAR